jgi:hypothetical protein
LFQLVIAIVSITWVPYAISVPDYKKAFLEENRPHLIENDFPGQLHECNHCNVSLHSCNVLPEQLLF